MSATGRISIVTRVVAWLRKRPLPYLLVNLLLMVRWRCFVHPGARIDYPSGLKLARGVRIGRATLICRGPGRHPVQLSERVIVHDGVILDAHFGSIEIGVDTTINPYCVFYGTGGLRLGSHCGVATHSVMVAANHGFALSDIPMMQQPGSAQGITLADDVWVGAGARIMDGVTVSRGCVIAAGAVVTRSFPAGHVIGGVPARTVKLREGF